jgi:uncharacterized membrane protein
MLRALARCFLAGLFTVLPLVVTGAIVIWVAGFLDRLFGPQTPAGRILGRIGLTIADDSLASYVIGWIFVLAAVFGVGVLVEMGARKFINDRLDSLLARVPLLGGVYGTVRQLVGMMDTKGGADLQGMSVVYCTFGQETGAVFLALLPTPQVFRLGEIDYHAVLVPTAPVPMGGSLLFVPIGSVRQANLSVDAFMSIYVSMGVTGPQFLPSAP